MSERELLREIARRLESIERTFRDLLRAFLRPRSPRLTPPDAGTLTGNFTLGATSTMSKTVLIATIPLLRQDGSSLPAADIASITYQKTPAGAAAGSAPAVLQTNSALAGAGLAPADLTFTDASAAAGDAYEFFVTDTAGNAGAESNSFVNTAAAGGGGGAVSPPAAGELSGTFTP